MRDVYEMYRGGKLRQSESSRGLVEARRGAGGGVDELGMGSLETGHINFRREKAGRREKAALFSFNACSPIPSWLLPC